MQRFRWRPKRLLLGVALPLFCLASAESARADSKVYQDVLHSTGLVEAPHPEGRITYGTCWLMDDEHRLALTAQHVVKAAAEVVVYFPAYRDGTVIHELAHYHRHVAAVRGWVVHSDMDRDLAVLQLDGLPDHVKALPLAAQSAGPGDTVHSVGNSGVLEGKLWRYTAGKVRSVYQAEIRTEDALLKLRVILPLQRRVLPRQLLVLFLPQLGRTNLTEIRVIAWHLSHPHRPGGWRRRVRAQAGHR